MGKTSQMVIIMWQGTKKIWRHDRGMFTIESSLVFPIVFFATLALIFFGFFVFQRGLHHYQATVVSERAAFNYNNSYRDPATGVLSDMSKDGSLMFDGAYWRLIPALRQKNGKDAVIYYALETFSSKEASPFIIEESMEVDSEALIFNKISTEIESQLLLPDILADLFNMDDRPAAQAESTVVEPVELMRNVRLIKNYLIP